jgi:hypothetical protein
MFFVFFGFWGVGQALSKSNVGEAGEAIVNIVLHVKGFAERVCVLRDSVMASNSSETHPQDGQGKMAEEAKANGALLQIFAWVLGPGKKTIPGTWL